MKFELVVKAGIKELARIPSNPKIIDIDVTPDDIEKIIPTEQYLERLFGLRFHINGLTK